MAVESGGFSVDGVDWMRTQSRELIANRMPAPSVRVGIRSASIRCLNCGHTWRATRGSRPGQILPVVGNALPMECTECKQSGVIKVTDLNRSA
jgi:hypothetical protein